MTVEVPGGGPLRLYLVRHGRTRYNEEGRIQGRCDSELTETGVAEVARNRGAAADGSVPAGVHEPVGTHGRDDPDAARTPVRHAVPE